MAEMTIKRSRDVAANRYIMHRVADYRGGMGVFMPNLPEGTVIPEGSPVVEHTLYESGGSKSLAMVLRGARVSATTASSSKEVKVYSAEYLAVGDQIFALAQDGTARSLGYIKSITKGSYLGASDTLEFGSAVGDGITFGTSLMAVDLTDGTTRFIGVTGSDFVVTKDENVQIDVWVMAVVSKKQPLVECTLYDGYRSLLPDSIAIV